MASLANVSPGSSYPGLLKTENNTGITGPQQIITDGNGSALPLRISSVDITNRGGGNVTSNAAFGEGALICNVSGNQNAAFGGGALGLTTASNNVAMGSPSQNRTTTGTWNTSMGSISMFHNTTGSFNTAIGRSALRYNTSGFSNSALGACALFNNRNVASAIGNLEGGSGYTDGIYSGILLTPVPSTSLGGQGFYANVEVSGGTVISVTLTGSLYVNIGEKYTSTAIGAGGTGFSIEVTSADAGENNTGVGFSALKNNILGKLNTGLGYEAGSGLNNGSFNVAVGPQSLFATNGMSCATAIGYRSLYSNTTGANNTAVGALSLNDNTTGSFNSSLGANTISGNFSSSVILGACATATGNNQFVVGATGAFNAGAITAESISPTHTWLVKINGQDYKIPLVPA